MAIDRERQWEKARKRQNGFKKTDRNRDREKQIESDRETDREKFK